MANGNEGRFTGLLSNPLFNLGVGLLGSGLSRTDSTGQALLGGLQAGQQLQSTALENQATRRALQQQARQRQAQQSLIGDLTQGVPTSVTGPGPGMGAVENIQTPQQKQLALLAQANPDAFTQGLMNQQFAETRAAPSIIRTAEFLFPDDVEAQRNFVQSNSGTPEIENLTKQMEAQLALIRAQQQRGELEDAEAERQSQRIAAENSVLSGVSRLQKIAGINNRLAQVSEQTGLSLPELGLSATDSPAGRRAAMFTLTNVVGLPQSQAQQLVNDATLFNNLTSKEALDALARNEALGSGTNAKLQAVFQTKPGFGQTPQTNAQIIADALKSLRDAAEEKRVKLSDTQLEILNNDIQRLEAFGSPNQSGKQGNGQQGPVDLGDGVTLEFN